MNIFLVLEESGGRIKRVSWEALAAALRARARAKA